MASPDELELLVGASQASELVFTRPPAPALSERLKSPSRRVRYLEEPQQLELFEF